MKADFSVTRFALLFACFIAFLGFLPHALFSWNAGGWHFIATAWDEDSYARYAIEGYDIVFRLASAIMLRGLIAWLGIDWALIGVDIGLPFILALIAIAIAYQAGFRTRRGLFLAACLMLFALELMALCNTTMFGGDPAKMLPFTSFFYPDWFRMFVPNLIQKFFSIYKTPEPQLSYLLQFACLYFLLRHAMTQKQVYLVLLALLSFLFPYFYVSTGIALLVCIAMYACAGLLLNRNLAYTPLLLGTFVSSAYYVLVFLNGIAGPEDADFHQASNYVYHSRLPIVSASLLWAAFVLWVWYRKTGKAWLKDRRIQLPDTHLLGLACLSVPFITLNQQILTGSMVQSRTWDYFSNPPFVALAILIFWPLLASLRVPRWFARLKPVALPLLVILIVQAQHKTYRSQVESNLETLAAAQGLAEMRKEGEVKNIMLANTGNDSQMILRLGPPYPRIVNGYQGIIHHPITPLARGEERYLASAAPLRDQAFAYFDLHCRKPKKFESLMLESAKKADGSINLMFFFALLDAWAPLTDYRRASPEAVSAQVPALIDDYRAFLKNPKRRTQFGELLFITREKREICEDTGWNETIAKEATLGSSRPVTAYIYRMTPK